jgi:hypothetical protein
VLTGVVLVVLGLGGVRLSRTVRRRERLRLAEIAAAERAERQAAKDAARGRDVVGYRAEPVVEPVAPPVVRPASPISPATGHPVEPDFAAANRPGTLSASDAEARSSAADAPGAPRPPFHG